MATSMTSAFDVIVYADLVLEKELLDISIWLAATRTTALREARN